MIVIERLSVYLKVRGSAKPIMQNTFEDKHLLLFRVKTQKETFTNISCMPIKQHVTIANIMYSENGLASTKM